MWLYIKLFFCTILKGALLMDAGDLCIPHIYGYGNIKYLPPIGFKVIITGRKGIIENCVFRGNMNKPAPAEELSDFGYRMKRTELNDTHYKWEYVYRGSELYPGDIICSVIQMLLLPNLVVTMNRNIKVVLDREYTDKELYVEKDYRHRITNHKKP